MSCRQWLSSAARQCQSALAQQPQQPRAFSTSAPVESFRRIFPDNKARPQDGSALSSGSSSSSSSSRQPSFRRTFPNSNRSAAGRGSRSTNPNEALHGLVSDGMERGGPLSPEEQRQVMKQQSTQYHVKDFRANAVTENYVRQMPRRWRTGDVYAPRDMSSYEMSKWRQGKSPDTDVVDVLGFNPLDNYKNFSIISEFITPMGRIKHSVDTGLRPVNQRKMAKAIRRAIGMGLHPSVHKHPEILRFGRHGVPTASVPTPTDLSQTRL